MFTFYGSEFLCYFKLRNTVQTKEFYPENHGTLPPLYISLLKYPEFL